MVKRSGARPAFAFAALFAILLQAFVVQTHIHAPVAVLGVAVAQSEIDLSPHAQASTAADRHQAVACPICQTLASAGSAVLAGKTSTEVAPRVEASAVSSLSPVLQLASHSWRSRAPPSLEA